MIMNSQQQQAYLLDSHIPFDSLKVQFFQQLVCDLNSSDIQKINYANTLLTKLKEDRGISENVNLIIDQCKSHQTILYVLMIFEQQLKTIWSSLDQSQKNITRDYMSFLFNRIAPTDDGITQTVYRKIKLIIVKIFLAEYRESDVFLEKLIEEAKGDQWRCENVLELFSLLGDEIQTAGITFLQSKYVIILTLAAMVLQSSKDAKIKNNLVKNSLIVLQKFISLGKDIVLPHEIVSFLLTTLQSNKFRIQICNLLSIICKSSPQTRVPVTETVLSLLDWTCSVQSFRTSTTASDLTYTDLFFRALSNLVHNLILTNLQASFQISKEHLRSCFKMNLCLSESEDQETWTICKQSWVLYVRNRLNLLDSDQTRILADILVFKCEQPLLLSNKMHESQTQDQAEESSAASDFEDLLIQVARGHSETMFSKAWGFIECQTFAKFDRKKFESATFCFCHLQEALQGKNKIIDVLKLLMNISESVEDQYRRVAVDQFLNIVCFYPEISTENPGLARILEQKFIENLPHSINAFIWHQVHVHLSPSGVTKLQAKIKEFGCERVKLQTQLWRMILRAQNNTSDTRLSMELDPPLVLQAVVRNQAGLQQFGGRWNIRWEMLCHFATQVNGAIRAPNVEPMQKNIIQKVSEVLIKTCCLFCKVCSDCQLNFKTLPDFIKLVQMVQFWPNANRLKQYFI